MTSCTSILSAGQQMADPRRGAEYASYLDRGHGDQRPGRLIYGNVLNTGLIDNLPQDGMVEVPCLVDRQGVQPTHFGTLPTQLASLCQQHMAVHDLVATAVLEKDREAAIHAWHLIP